MGTAGNVLPWISGADTRAAGEKVSERDIDLRMKVVALAGGVGGAKLAQGLAQIVPAAHLTIIVNTGDDFEHLGLHISPDLDTVCYTLAQIANPRTGWGRSRETWHALSSLEELGGPGWFRIGDRDLGTHLERTRRLKAGEPLSQIARTFCQAWGVGQRILPMTDDPVRTIVRTNQGDLAFQEYFVRQHTAPRVKGFRFTGADVARPAPGVIESLKGADAVIICPSNPWVSIAPILAIPGVRMALEHNLVVGVSPIIGGKAIRGPADKMYRELGIEPSALAVGRQYGQLLGGFVMDRVDAKLGPQVRALGMQVLVTQTLMKSTAQSRRLALEILDFLGILQA